MIALDTNALVRLLTEDDPEQAKTVREIILMAEENGIQIIILSEVLIETVWLVPALRRGNAYPDAPASRRTMPNGPHLTPDLWDACFMDDSRPILPQLFGFIFMRNFGIRFETLIGIVHYTSSFCIAEGSSALGKYLTN